MQTSPMVAPVVALVAWSLIMLLWMIKTRFGALKAMKVDLGRVIGGRGSDLDGKVPDAIQWKAHNYNHLMEQPTLFYAAALALALIDRDIGIGPVPVVLAWGYVLLRIAHSLVQATSNVVRNRFLLFAAASACLVGMTICAGYRLIAG